MEALPLFLRLADRPVILLGEGEVTAAKRRLLERAGACVTDDEGAQAAIAIVAIEDDAAARAAVARLQARGVLVNAVDRPALCDFTLPAIVDRDPLIVAVGTGGASAGLAKAVRQRIEAMLPARLGALALALSAARGAIRQCWPGAAERRRAIDAALAAGGALDPLADGDGDGDGDGDARVAAWLAQDGGEGDGSRLVRLILASADPDDLSLRAARLLGEADRVYYHPDVPAAILVRARADAARIMADAPPGAPGAGLSLWLEIAR
ncbi:NAD(P)-dependent oxidoreductase [Sphingobium aquiterrae]|uniref:NAD(P)-dependent oxidoreductase n=1 Tax=Sphingobium aquiterrae TaxID=2038656 RepID=UPI0030183DE4